VFFLTELQELERKENLRKKIWRHLKELERCWKAFEKLSIGKNMSPKDWIHGSGQNAQPFGFIDQKKVFFTFFFIFTKLLMGSNWAI